MYFVCAVCLRERVCVCVCLRARARAYVYVRACECVGVCVCVCAVQLFFCVSLCTKHHNSQKKFIVFYEQEINVKNERRILILVLNLKEKRI
jgi:hypothetical protein